MNSEVIAKYKARHADIYLVEVENGEAETLEYLFKSPDRKTMSAAGKIAMTDPVRSMEVLIDNCLLEGDKKQLENSQVFQAVAEQFEVINKPREASIKKL